MKEFLNFDKMFTPLLIKIFYWISTVATLFASFAIIIGGVFGHSYNSGYLVLFGILLMILGPIFIRITCELIIVIFKIHESLVDIKNKISIKHTDEDNK